MTHDEAWELLSVFWKVRDFYREVIVAREAHDILESNVERYTVDILEFLQFFTGTQVKYEQNSSFADYCHPLLQRTDVQTPHGILDFRDVRRKRIVEIYFHHVPSL